MKTKSFLSLIPVLALLGTPAHADQVVFDNGDRLSGTIISMRDAKTLYFRSNIAGDMRIGWDKVVELYDADLNMISIPEAVKALLR